MEQIWLLCCLSILLVENIWSYTILTTLNTWRMFMIDRSFLDIKTGYTVMTDAPSLAHCSMKGSLFPWAEYFCFNNSVCGVHDLSSVYDLSMAPIDNSLRCMTSIDIKNTGYHYRQNFFLRRGHWIQFGRVGMTRTAALQYCKNLTAHLYTPEDKIDNDFLLSEMVLRDLFSMHYPIDSLKVKSSFRWQNGSEVLRSDIVPWKNGVYGYRFPNHTDPNCGVFDSTGVILMQDCDVTDSYHGFFCESVKK